MFEVPSLYEVQLAYLSSIFVLIHFNLFQNKAIGFIIPDI